MHTYKEFCQHYEYEESDDDSRLLYDEYKSQLQLFDGLKLESIDMVKHMKAVGGMKQLSKDLEADCIRMGIDPNVRT